MMTTRTITARLVHAGLASLCGLSALCLSPESPARGLAPAMAQSCQVGKTPNGAWEQRVQVGEVVTFGDLKIRIVQANQGNDDADYYGVVDMKAPGLATNGYRLNYQKPVKFTACGQEVTLTWDYGPTVRISVF